MARIGGNVATFLFAGGGVIDLTNMEGFAWEGRIGLQEEDTTPFGYYGVRRDTFLADASGTLSMLASSVAKAPIPTSTIGTLTLTATSGQTYVFSALISGLEMSPRSTGGAQRVQYRFSLSTQSTTATPIV